MKFEVGVLPPDHPDVIAVLHGMRKATPSAAATAKVELGYGSTFSKSIRDVLAVHPGFVEHCAPAQEFMHAQHALPAGVIASAAGWPAEFATANALQYATNCARIAADEAEGNAADSPQASLDL
jgi:hypothetical protein